MARISVYSKDTVIEKQDKVIGTDFSGSITKNYPFSGIAELFNKGIVNVGGQLGYKFSDILEEQAFSGPADNAAFSSLTTLKFSEIDGAEHNIENFILEYRNKRILLFDNLDKNKYGIYDVSTISEDSNNLDYYDFNISFISGNGNLILHNFYTLSMYGQDATYVHHQNNASTTWTINHGMGKFPSVSIKFSSSDQIYENVGAFAGVVYTDKNNLTINLAAAESGYAYLN